VKEVGGAAKRGDLMLERFLIGRKGAGEEIPAIALTGKGFDGTMAVGPWVVPKEEVGEPYPLQMELKVGGQVRQHGDTSDYVFRIPQILAHFSQGITFEPGDIISLGSLGGTPGFEFGKESRKLKAGDVIEAQIEKIGRLVLPVKPEATLPPAGSGTAPPL